MNFFGIFKAIGRWAKRAFTIAQENGLSDDVIKTALGLVREAAGQANDNATKREWVVTGLRATGLPESIARMAVEMAVQIWKRDDQP